MGDDVKGNGRDAARGDGAGEGAPRTAPVEEDHRSTLRRLGSFVTDHPLAALAVGVGAGALGGAEWCVGALVGGGVVALIAGRRAPELRRAMERTARQLADWGRARIAGGAAPRAPAPEQR